MKKALYSFEPVLRSLFRIMAAFTFSEHGWQKVFGVLGGHRFPVNSLLGAAGLLETVGGAFIFFGLFTRPVAFLLSGEMAFGYFFTHAPKSFWPIVSGGELAVFYCFLFLWLSAAGPGPVSLDHVLRGKR